MQVEPHDIADLRLRVGVGGDLEGLPLVGFQRVGPPAVMDHARGQARPARHLPPRLSAQPPRWRRQGEGHHLGDLPRGDRAGPPGARPLMHGRGALGAAPSADATDVDWRVPGQLGHLRAGHPVGHQAHGATPPGDARRCGWEVSKSFEFTAFLAGSTQSVAGVVACVPRPMILTRLYVRNTTRAPSPLCLKKL